MKHRTSDTHKRNKIYWDKELRFDREEFIEWAIPRLEQFFKDEPDETPSVDRIDPDGHYEFGNIRIYSWHDNSLRSRFHLRVFGINAQYPKERNLKNITRSALVLGEEVGITKEELIAYLLA